MGLALFDMVEKETTARAVPAHPEFSARFGCARKLPLFCNNVLDGKAKVEWSKNVASMSRKRRVGSA